MVGPFRPQSHTCRADLTAHRSALDPLPRVPVQKPRSTYCSSRGRPLRWINFPAPWASRSTRRPCGHRPTEK